MNKTTPIIFLAEGNILPWLCMGYTYELSKIKNDLTKNIVTKLPGFISQYNRLETLRWKLPFHNFIVPCFCLYHTHNLWSQGYYHKANCIIHFVIGFIYLCFTSISIHYGCNVEGIDTNVIAGWQMYRLTLENTVLQKWCMMYAICTHVQRLM